jgi:glutathione synthase/RimK-type ligase-like ATP-grasp enzyme
MLSILNLQYGAFDFIEKPDGELVFLEINPTGEWAWLENALGYPMRSAFIELFYGERYA